MLPLDIEGVRKLGWGRTLYRQRLAGGGTRYFVLSWSLMVHEWAAWVANADGEMVDAKGAVVNEGIGSEGMRRVWIVTELTGSQDDALWQISSMREKYASDPFSEPDREAALRELVSRHLARGVRPPGVAGDLFFSLYESRRKKNTPPTLQRRYSF